MRSSRFTEEQIIAILKEQEGARTAEVCRRHGISDATFYKWKAKYGGLEVSEARRLKALEDDNARLKPQKNGDACRQARGRGASPCGARGEPAPGVYCACRRSVVGPLPAPGSGRSRGARSHARAGRRAPTLRLSASALADRSRGHRHEPHSVIAQAAAPPRWRVDCPW